MKGGSVQITINSMSTSKLLKRLLCGKAMNYMKYRTIFHTVSVRTMLTTTRFIRSHVYLYHYECKYKYCYLKINTLILTTIHFINSYSSWMNITQPDSDKCSLHCDVWTEYQRVSAFISHLKWIIGRIQMFQYFTL